MKHPVLASATRVLPAVMAALLPVAAQPVAASDAGASAPTAKQAPPAASATRKATEQTARPAAPAEPVAKNRGTTLEDLRALLATQLGATPPPDAVDPRLMRITTRTEAAATGDRATRAARASGDVVYSASDVLGGRSAGRTRPPGETRHGERADRTDHWAYEGRSGPAAWGGLKPEFRLCANGQRQSPIDIRDGFAVELEPIRFDYRAGPFKVIDNGHTVQAQVEPGNAIEVGGRRYELQQFHFHRPSEVRVNGRQYEMDVHLVHRDAEGRLAVLALVLEQGEAQPAVQAVWNNLPLEKHELQPAVGALDPADLLPRERGYYTYMGSLTTPPCSEGVLWLVMQTPVPASAAQIEIFSRLYPMNARPVQAASGRMIKQSQ